MAAVAAGFIGFLSLFNIYGPLFLGQHVGHGWAGAGTFAGLFRRRARPCTRSWPTLAHGGHLALFAAAFAVILSMYGGGFATIPAYLADLFGPGFVGAIHGRLLTAWSAAGLIGPEIVNDFRASQLAAGVPRARIYDHAMLVLAGLLVRGVPLHPGRAPRSGKLVHHHRPTASRPAREAHFGVPRHPSPRRCCYPG